MIEEEKLPPPPYVAFRSFANFLDWLEEGGVPSRIDRSFWGEKLSGGYGTQLMSALRFLGLLGTDDRPDPVLETMAKDREQRKTVLRELLRTHYRPALDGLDLERATLGELEERFRRYGLQGETHRKAVAFFVHAAQYAELPLSAHIIRRTKTRRTNGGRPRRRQRTTQRPSAEAALPSQPESRSSGLGLHPSLEALLGDLKRIGNSWTSAERERWVATFLSNVDWAYPVKEEQSE